MGITVLVQPVWFRYCNVAEDQGKGRKETHERKQTKIFTTQGLFSTLVKLPKSGPKS